MKRLLGVGLVVLAIALALLARDGARPRAPRLHAYPDAATATFMAGCQRSGGSYPVCNCLIITMQERYTYEQFQALAAGAALTSRPEYRQVAAACAAGA